MKTLFIPAFRKIKSDIDLINEISEKIPDSVLIAYSVQFRDLALEIKKILSKNNTDNKSKITGIAQVLGCSKPDISKYKNTKAILLIGEGKFHALSLAHETKLPVYLFEAGKLKKISESEIADFEKKKKVSLMNFLSSEKIGILVSTKPGQENLQTALNLKKSEKLKEKKSYLFIANELNSSDFENFSDIQSWVNTACPRMDMNSSKIINMNEIF